MGFPKASSHKWFTPLFKTALVLLILLSLVAGDVFAAKHSRSSSKKSKAESGGHGSKASRKSPRGKGKSVARGRKGKRGRRSRQGTYDVADASQTGRSSGAGIPAERATEIQNALIKLGYLDAPASGQWDDRTQDASKDFQSDNGLPPTGQPSAAMLKKLGVSKRPNDGYAVPVSSVTTRTKEEEKAAKEKDKKPPKNP
ncbi:MAG TPA: peptidoglycan-binding domain-containing protein [Blastocatellia bacterium]|nr:peptidoglycan-binding domain-containing protein [Blastocatellia bacterium]